MAKSAALKKDVKKVVVSQKQSSAKTQASAKKNQKMAKPQLKVVTSNPKSTAATPAKKTAKPAMKLVAPLKHAPKAPLKKAAAKVTVKPFGIGMHVVYPTHGVGRIVAEETQEVAGTQVKMFVIAFDRDRMTLRVPVARAQAAGLRHICSTDSMDKVFVTLKAKPKVSRGMWSRRAQEYEGKINSGNIFSIAEVVRDLHNNVDQSERSYSERMIYENAFHRLCGEYAACKGLEVKNAGDKLLTLLRTKAAA